jgi:hypothetical protein
LALGSPLLARSEPTARISPDVLCFATAEIVMTTMSPGLDAAAKMFSTYARKLSPFIGHVSIGYSDLPIPTLRRNFQAFIEMSSAVFLALSLRTETRYRALFSKNLADQFGDFGIARHQRNIGLEFPSAWL